MNNSYTSGIYKITNTINNCFYIGSAVNINSRLSKHKSRLNQNNHHSKYIQNAWNKYGSNSFSYEVLFYCSKSDLIFYEQRAIDIYKPKYNMCLIAGSTLGKKCSDETKSKMSEKARGRIPSEETKKKISESSKGRKMSQRNRDILYSIIKDRQGDKNPMYGKTQSDKSKLASSITHKGKKLSKETIEKRTATRKRNREAKEAELLASLASPLLD